ncbi:MAG: RNA 2',3'-cyclic phosphodiesterase [Methanomicrobiales archaeon]|nr:RNA 2',3'-cyclic phosphodiesterase [Methanomicrobiales archaeon]
MVRIFIAIDLPRYIKEQIRESQTILSTTGAKLTLVNPDVTHITLKFIGEVDLPRLDAIVKAFSTILFEPFSYEVHGIAGNNRHSPRVIWGNVQDKGHCARLHHIIEDTLSPLGISRENRAFTPHITFARVKTFHPSLLAVLRGISQTQLGSGEVHGIHLKKSTLLADGPRYEDIAEVVWS